MHKKSTKGYRTKGCTNKWKKCKGIYAKESSADWSAKERCGKLLTRNFGVVGPKLLQPLAVGQNTDVTCETFGTFAEASLADWSAKEGCGRLLTRNFGDIGFKFRQQLAIGQNTDVTCESFGTFAESSWADWSAKERCGKLTSDSSAQAYVKYR